MNNKQIEQLFFKQIKDLTTRTAMKSYDYQFSDGWLQTNSRMAARHTHSWSRGY